MSDTVKLIIEIPKEAKQAFDKAESNDLKGGYYDHGGVIGKAIQNGIPLDDIPSVENKGEWIEKCREVFKYYCDKCNTGSDLRTNFCPNCGADMRGE